MTGKECLIKMRTLDLMIDTKLEQVTDLRMRLMPGAIRYDKDRVQTSPSDDALPDTISKVIDLEKEINADIDELIDLKAQVNALVSKLKSDEEKIILLKRYFDKKTFEQIAVECGYSWRTVHRMHKKALQNFEKIYRLS